MRSLAPLISLLIVGGCASSTVNAPSLLPRPIETRSNDEPEVTPPVVTADAALDAEISTHVASVNKAAAAFGGAAKAAEARLLRARRAAIGSDAWLDAQTAIADLGAARAATDSAVGELEALGIARAEKGLPSYPALDAALETANAELTRENETTTRLSAILDR